MVAAVHAGEPATLAGSWDTPTPNPDPQYSRHDGPNPDIDPRPLDDLRDCSPPREHPMEASLPEVLPDYRSWGRVLN